MNTQRTQPRQFTLPERVHIAKTLHAFGLGALRLPGITIGPICHGLSHGCICQDCLTERGVAVEPPAQPWHPRPVATRHAA